MSLKNGEKVRVNIRTSVNAASIYRGQRNNREVIIVPSATLPDNVVMNNILYPAEEIDKSYRTLNRTPAPFGHPTDEDGNFMPASDVEAQNAFGFGAFNDNARRDNGRVFLDKIIDVERANECEMGRRVLEAIDKGDPIHTSTGLLCVLEDANEGDAHDFVARDIYFDHDAILLDEEGAATPDQGVGMMVNKSSEGKEEKIPVLNFYYDEDDFDQTVEMAADMVARAAERRKERETRAPLAERLKSVLYDTFGMARQTETNSKEDDDMSVSKEEFDALSAKVDGLVDGIAKLDVTEAVTNALKPLSDKVDGIVTAQNADAVAHRTDVVEQLIANGSIKDADEAAETPTPILEKLLNTTGTAAPIRGNSKVGKTKGSGYTMLDE